MAKEKPNISKATADAAELPNAELDILTCLLNRGPSTARELRDALQDRRPMAHASALTFLARLERKGLVQRERVPGQRGHVYRPTRKPESTYRRLLDDLAERVFGGSYVKLVTSLYKDRKPGPDEIAQLRKLLKDLENANP